MSDENYRAIIAICVVAIVLLIWFNYKSEALFQKIAIQHGKAEYKIVNTNTGATKFFWITNR